jgi:hypothetical protein
MSEIQTTNLLIKRRMKYIRSRWGGDISRDPASLLIHTSFASRARPSISPSSTPSPSSCSYTSCVYSKSNTNADNQPFPTSLPLQTGKFKAILIATITTGYSLDKDSSSCKHILRLTNSVLYYPALLAWGKKTFNLSACLR